MRIVVCIKQISQVYARTGMEPQGQFLAEEDRISRVNPYDEAAMELALRIRESLGMGVEILGLTLGPLLAEEDLMRCAAMGADDLYHLETKEATDSWGKAVMLAKAIREIRADIIFCGKESLDRRNGQVGFFIAHLLGFPVVSAVLDVQISGDPGLARIERKGGHGKREILECPLPAVFTAEMGSVLPRLPTYENRRRASLLSMKKVNLPDGPIPSRVSHVKTFPPRPRPKAIPAPDNRLASHERIDKLLSGSRGEKKGILCRDTAEAQVERILSYLDEQGFLNRNK